MIGMIRSLQLILHLPIFQIIMPSNVILFFQLVIPFVMFDVFENAQGWGPQMILEFDDQAQEELQDDILDQMRDLGYESHNLIQNLNSLALFLSLYFLQVFFALLILMIAYFSKGKWGTNEIYQKMKKRLFFNEIINILIEGYLEFLIAGILNFRAPLDTMNGEITSTIMGFIVLILALIALPGCAIYVLCQDLQKVNTEEFRQKWKPLVEPIKTKNRWTLAFMVVYIFRRIAYLGLGFIITSQLFQIISLLLLNLFLTIYVGSSKPFILPLENKLELFNEWIIFLSALHMIVFTDFLDDLDAQFLMGWSLVGACIIKMVVNLVFVIYFSYKFFYLLIVKYYNRAYAYFNKDNKPEQVEEQQEEKPIEVVLKSKKRGRKRVRRNEVKAMDINDSHS